MAASRKQLGRDALARGSAGYKSIISSSVEPKDTFIADLPWPTLRGQIKTGFLRFAAPTASQVQPVAAHRRRTGHTARFTKKHPLGSSDYAALQAASNPSFAF